VALGSFCLVLHGHVPYVLRHGVWPHGEDWLYEAAAETYLPLLAAIDECEYMNGNPRLTVGLTPILLEQLSHEQFKRGFEHYLKDRSERARADRKDFSCAGESHFVGLADRWLQFYAKTGERFAQIDRDIPGAFAERAARGQVEILTSAATHAYLPLLYEDSCVRAQLRAGLSTSQCILGMRPTGLWLPECSYRPPGHWHPPIRWGAPRDRAGLEQLAADEGLTHFFVEHRLIEQSRSEWVNNNGWQKVDWEEAIKYARRGWRSPLEPVWVASDGGCPERTAAFGRDLRICEQVWSGSIGYPADGAYLEFHKRRGERRGLRYWRIVGHQIDLSGKEPYRPEHIAGKVYEHARHFCESVRQHLRDYHNQTGRHGVVVACFDAELFGHWWFEGPQFLRDVMLTLNADPEVEVCTAADYLERHPPDKAVALPEGSWGDGGDHRVWVNDKVNWMWEVEYRCEAQFGKLTYSLPWRERPELREILEKAGRELLLLQASDWLFVIARGQAVDYGIKRFIQHVGRFDCLADIAEKLTDDSGYLGKLTETERFEVRDADIHDVVFPKVDLNWWNLDAPA
jgi:1,4-alpha-glucan branching enzyme